MEIKPSVLFVTPIIGHPPKGGPEIRIENSIKALSKIARVTVYCRKRKEAIGGDEADRFLRRYAVDVLYPPMRKDVVWAINLAKRIANKIFRTLFGRNVFVLSNNERAEFRDIVKKAVEIDADIVWLGYGNISYPLLRHIKKRIRVPVVVDTDSVWSRFVLRGIAYARDDEEIATRERDGRGKEEEEAWGTKLADVTTAVSEIDAQYYRKLANNPESVHVFSNVIEPEAYLSNAQIEGIKKPCMFLAGTFGPRSPMHDAARWLLDMVMPILKERGVCPHLYIAGIGSSAMLANTKDENVTIVGEVSSIVPYLRNATISVVPLRYESGTRFKILEAGACGIPVVSTTLGAEGIPAVHGKEIMIADTPVEFARSIEMIVKDADMAKRLGDSLRALVLGKYTINNLADEGEEIVGFLMGSAKKNIRKDFPEG